MKGTLFRGKGRPGAGGGVDPVQKPDHVLAGAESAPALEKREAERSVAYLYEYLYPAAVDEASNVPGFDLLFPYQRVGVQFLAERTEALLADEMGLGKTAQCSIAIAILMKQERISRALVICPRSIILQWQAEALKFGGLRAKIIDGPVNGRKLAWKYQKGLVLTTPQIVNNDAYLLKDEVFDLVVCDDISMLKNPGQITLSIRSLKRLRTWCMTGTPLENKPEDLTNTFEFVCPGLFGYNERQHAPSKGSIDKRITPFFLRRRKVDHLAGLPDKISVGPIVTEMVGAQLKAYRDAELLEWKALHDAGVAISKFHIFPIIAALVKLCNLHAQSGTSVKAELLDDALDTILSQGQDNKAIVFSHDLQALAFLEMRLARFKPVFYRGALSSRQREEVLSKFKTASPLLLGSVKACDRGLNLQEASYVFHFDRTWNPINELQAEDRCWRHGQKKTVFVYRYLVRGTIEERIAQVLSEKKSLFDAYIDSKSMTPDQIEDELANKLTLDDFLRIIRPPDILG